MNKRPKKIIMKKIFSITAFLMLLVVTSCEKEGIYEEGLVYQYDISLYSQEDVNEFAKNKYSGIIGNLEISGTGISYIDSLYSLNFVKGTVHIYNTSIKNTFGLDNLTTIAENGFSSKFTNLFISENTKLLTVNFPKLLTLKGSFNISDNEKLFGIYIPKIPLTETLIKIENNPELVDMNFNALKHIGGMLVLRYTGLENLMAFSSVISMQDTFPISGHHDAGIWIGGNANLISLDGLSGLSKIAGHCLISHNPLLKEIDALASVTTVDHGIELQYNDVLENLDGFQNITSVDAGIVINQNGSLTDLCGLSNCYNNAVSFLADWNAYNPSYQDMVMGNCSQ